MVVVRMAQDDGVDAPDGAEVRQAPGLGSLAAIEQETAAVGLDHEGGGLLGSKT